MKKPRVFGSTKKQMAAKIEEMEAEALEDLENEISGKTGGDNWHNPAKVIKLAKQMSLEELRKTFNEVEVMLQEPKDNKKVRIGHKIAVKVDRPGGGPTTKSKLTFHICNTIDAQILGSKVNTAATRMLSTDTPLGKKILGKKPSDTVEVNEVKYTVESIEVSELL